MRRGWFVFLFLLAFASIVQAASLDESLRKVTHYAEEYETGNIDYAQLIVYTSSLQGELATMMGAVAQGHDAVLDAAQLEQALGKPTEHTKWVWVEGQNREKKLESEAAAWRKIIFDGETIQLWLGAWPNLLVKDGNERLFYRLHLDVQFKQEEEAIDIEDDIERIAKLAEEFNTEPSDGNLERLAEESVSAEQIFNSNFNQNPAQCGEIMNDLFGSENKRENQNLLVQQISFFESDKIDAIMRLEMCDDCEWNWININMWYEARGGFNQPNEESRDSRGQFEGLSSEQFKQRTKELVDEAKGFLEAGDYQSAQGRMSELRVLTDAWNEQANNVWEQFEGQFQVDSASMTQAEQEECSKTYCWLKANQERMLAEKTLRKANYEERKAFYLDLFAGYEKKEFYSAQKQWETRLFEAFKESGKETCNNNVDDNTDGQIDCGDAQCGGQICGYDKVMVNDTGAMQEKEVALYCIASTCQQREEVVSVEVVACGNNVCEEGEADSVLGIGTCAADCVQCSVFEPLACDGNVVFSGQDAQGCPLEPVCIEETFVCTADVDCRQPLCGTSSCVEGLCQTTVLDECRVEECAAGEKRRQMCGDGNIITDSVCEAGVWIETGVVCASGVPGEEVQKIEEEQELLGDACVMRSDCGGEHDVCSNGQCVSLPDLLESEEVDEEIIETGDSDEIGVNEETEEQAPETSEASEEQTESAETSETSGSGITGNAIFSFFKTFTQRFTSALVVDEGGGEGGEGGVNSGEAVTSEGGDNLGENNAPGENEAGNDGPEFSPDDERQREDERQDDEREGREQENKERQRTECRERCDREFYDGKIRPCTEDCILETCGQNLQCNIDDVRVTCESSCTEKNSLESGAGACFDKCLAGENTWVEPEREERAMEKFVFTVGGSCREIQGKEEGSIWFGGWGEGFDDFHLVKNKYFLAGGGNDWCERDLENLIRQRKELEQSLNSEFARWFFEQYVANSADEWQNHVSGIFDLYWRDVDLSRQMAERLRCLDRTDAPSGNLINFKYESDYGSVEFWEEVKSAKLEGFEEDIEIISPYMKVWLFPSRDFFKREMQRAMKQHLMPGPAEKQIEKRNGPSEEEKERLREDEGFMEFIREFNGKYGENLAVQFKDINTGEVMLNIYVRLNEKELLYFEPMLPEEMPDVGFSIVLNSEKLLDIVEFGESGHVELQSPPWDQQSSVGFVENVVDGAQMYLKFRALMGSMQVTPESAEGDAKRFMREFFGLVMGDDDRNRGDPDGEKQGEEEFSEGFEEGESQNSAGDKR